MGKSVIHGHMTLLAVTAFRGDQMKCLNEVIHINPKSKSV